MKRVTAFSTHFFRLSGAFERKRSDVGTNLYSNERVYEWGRGGVVLRERGAITHKTNAKTRENLNVLSQDKQKWSKDIRQTLQP